MPRPDSDERLPILPTPGWEHPRYSRLRFLAAGEGGDGTPGAGGAPDGSKAGGEAGGEFTPITNQDELDRAFGKRLERERTKLERERAKFADYDALKADAEKYRQGQDASKSELDKATDRIGALEQALEASQHAALRARIQAKFAVSDDDAELFLTAIDEAGLTKQAERLAERATDRKKSGNTNPLAGYTPTNDSGDNGLSEITRALFNRD